MAGDLTFALAQCIATRWAGLRTLECSKSQAKIGLAALQARGVTRSEQASPEVLVDIIVGWRQDGAAPATINKRLNCLSAMGVDVRGLRARTSKALKWWLKPAEEERAVRWLQAHGHGITCALIQWTTRTGLRIEESLRLNWERDIDRQDGSVTVPGTKNEAAQDTIAVSDATLRLLPAPCTGPCFQGLTYRQFWSVWERLRVAMEWPEGATPKALRRSAARYLHVDKGMPLDMAQKYLRHESVKTTQGYLRVAGGMDLDQQRRFIGR